MSVQTLSPGAAPPNHRFFASALYDYEAGSSSEEDYLSFPAGTLFSIVHDIDGSSGWWGAVCITNGAQGWVPMSYLETISDEDASLYIEHLKTQSLLEIPPDIPEGIDVDPADPARVETGSTVDADRFSLASMATYGSAYPPTAVPSETPTLPYDAAFLAGRRFVIGQDDVQSMNSGSGGSGSSGSTIRSGAYTSSLNTASSRVPSLKASMSRITLGMKENGETTWMSTTSVDSAGSQSPPGTATFQSTSTGRSVLTSAPFNSPSSYRAPASAGMTPSASTTSFGSAGAAAAAAGAPSFPTNHFQPHHLQQHSSSSYINIPIPSPPSSRGDSSSPTTLSQQGRQQRPPVIIPQGAGAFPAHATVGAFHQNAQTSPTRSDSSSGRSHSGTSNLSNGTTRTTSTAQTSALASSGTPGSLNGSRDAVSSGGNCVLIANPPNGALQAPIPSPPMSRTEASLSKASKFFGADVESALKPASGMPLPWYLEPNYSNDELFFMQVDETNGSYLDNPGADSSTLLDVNGSDTSMSTRSRSISMGTGSLVGGSVRKVSDGYLTNPNGTSTWNLSISTGAGKGKGKQKIIEVVESGTKRALIEYLTTPQPAYRSDQTFRDSLLCSYRSFMSGHELVDMLMKQYEMEDPEGLNEDEFDEWRKSRLRPTQQSVLLVFGSWVTDHHMIESEPEEIGRLKEFLKNTSLTGKAAPLARSLLNQIYAKESGDGTVSPSSPSSYTSPITHIGTSRTRRRAPFLRRSTRNDLLKFDASDVASQLTIMEHNLYSKVSANEVVAFGREGDYSKENVRNLARYCGFNFKLCSAVIFLVLSAETVKARRELLTHIIKIMDKCRGMNNYASVHMLMRALTSAPLKRLTFTWQGVEHKGKIQSMEPLTNSANNYAGYSDAYNKVHDGVCIPYLGMYLPQIKQVHEGSEDVTVVPSTDASKPPVELINFEKRRRMAWLASQGLRFQARLPANDGFVEIPELAQYIEEQLENVSQHSDEWLNHKAIEVQRKEESHSDIRKGLAEAGF